MAHLQFFKKKEQGITKDVISQKIVTDEYQIIENEAAIKIQSWFRSLQIQKLIKFLHQCALLIQKTYRGYVARRLYRLKVQNEVNIIRKAYYDRIITKIQARWRGFYVRKYKFDYYARNEYLKALVIKNELVRKELEKIKLAKEEELERQKIEKELASTLYKNRKNHYLLSTKVSRGIYNSPTKPYPEKERALQDARPLSQSERDELNKFREEAFLQTATGIPTESPGSFKREITPPLPPLKTKKMQGPFRDPLDVHCQRYKKLEPTLRVATEYTSVDSARALLRQEEWTKRVLENSFLPSTKRTETYVPSLHSSSTYGRLKYGTKHFRDPSPEKEIHSKEFQRVASPIPLFDQLGKTY